MYNHEHKSKTIGNLKLLKTINHSEFMYCFLINFFNIPLKKAKLLNSVISTVGLVKHLISGLGFYLFHAITKLCYSN